MLLFSPDGTRLATVEADLGGTGGREVQSATTTVKVWSINTPGQTPIFSSDVLFKIPGNWQIQATRSAAWAFSPDRSRLALGVAMPGDKQGRMRQQPGIHVWNVTTGNLLGHLPTSATMSSIAFSPDGKRLAGIGVGPRIQAEGKADRVPLSQVFLWDGADADKLIEVPAPQFEAAQKPDTLAQLVGNPKAQRLAYSPDGKRLLVYRDSSAIWIFNAATGEEVQMVKCIGHPDRVVFNEDGTRFFSLASFEVRSKVSQWVWSEWDTATPDQDIKVPIDRPDVKEITIWSRNGERQATYTRRVFFPSASIRDRDGKEIRVLKHEPPILREGIKEWRELGDGARTGIKGMVDVGMSMRSVTFSPSGRFVLTVANRPVNFNRNNKVKKDGLPIGHEWKLWETDSDALLRSYFASNENEGFLGKEPEWEKFTKVSPDGRFLALRDAEGVLVLDFDDPRKELLRVRGADQIYFSTNGKRLISGKLLSGTWSEIKIWDVESGRLVSSHPANDAELGFTLDGRCYVAIKQGEAETILLDPGTDQRWILKGARQQGEFGLLLFSPDQTRLLTSGQISHLMSEQSRLWDLESGSELQPLEGAFASRVVFSPDSKRLAALVREQLKVCDAATGQELLKVLVGKHSFRNLTFTDNGHRLTANDRAEDSSLQSEYLERTWDATPREEPKR